MANMDSCFHCTEKLLDNQYSCTINNNTCYFCCPACLAITQTIFNSGFDSYYQQRDNKPKRLPRHHFDLWNNPTLQMEFVSHHGNQFTAELYIALHQLRMAYRKASCQTKRHCQRKP
jgi:Cu2+-exporting ATPase